MPGVGVGLGVEERPSWGWGQWDRKEGPPSGEGTRTQGRPVSPVTPAARVGDRRQGGGGAAWCLLWRKRAWTVEHVDVHLMDMPEFLTRGTSLKLAYFKFYSNSTCINVFCSLNGTVHSTSMI